MQVGESRFSPALSTAYVKVVVSMYPLYVSQCLCAVMQAAQVGSCRRSYGRKIAVLYRPALLRYCLFTLQVSIALIASHGVGVEVELCTRQMEWRVLIHGTTNRCCHDDTRKVSEIVQRRELVSICTKLRNEMPRSSEHTD
jgi:hypothetical protein